MKRQSIRQHLQPYSILNRRRTTINHAFASALAPYDTYDDAQVSQAIRDLGQDPDADLTCFYCDKRLAETWDHVFGLVKDEQYAGFGHMLGNLVPSCKECNSAKGNRGWQEFLEIAIPDKENRSAKITRIHHYLELYLPDRFGYEQIFELFPEEVKEFEATRTSILSLMRKADEIAESIRRKVTDHLSRES
jgi:5-methylcytosine-specific restriction endonuclease McrA